MTVKLCDKCKREIDTNIQGGYLQCYLIYGTHIIPKCKELGKESKMVDLCLHCANELVKLESMFLTKT